MCTLNNFSHQMFDCKLQTLHQNQESEEVVISGVSAPFLDFLDIYRNNAQNSFDSKTTPNGVVSQTETSNKNIKDIKNFDSGYFETSFQDELDLQAQFCTREATKAIIDAGINPSELRDSITGVFLEKYHNEDETQRSKSGFEVIANKICSTLKLRGPLMAVNAFNKSAIKEAAHAIRTCLCDGVLIGSYDIPFESTGIDEFDSDVASKFENTVFIFLQKSRNARRIYGRVIGVNDLSVEWKATEVSLPSPKAHPRFGKEFELDCYVDLEKLGIPLSNNKNKELICRKTEDTSNLFKEIIFLAKEVIFMENHLTKESLKGSNYGKVEFIFKDEITDVISVTTANSQVFLQSNEKLKLDKGIPRDDLPRLLCVSGTSKNSLTTIFDDLGSRILDAECIGLCHKIFRREILGHCFRGFSILTRSEELLQSKKYFGGQKIPLVLIFTDFGDSWSVIANYLYVLPIFAASIKRFYNALASKKVNVIEIVLNSRKSKTITSFNRVIGTAAVQIGIADILRILDIVPDYYYGCGVAEIICGYLDGIVGFKETVLSIHHVALMSENIYEKGHGRRHHKTSFDGGKLGKIKPHLLSVLDQILQEPKQRSEKWLFLNGSKLFTVEDYVSGIDTSYFSPKHLLNYLNRKSILLEIGSGIQDEENFQHHFTFEPARRKNGFLVFLEILGRLYELGYNFKADQLYPKVAFPVSRGTPMISPWIK